MRAGLLARSMAAAVVLAGTFGVSASVISTDAGAAAHPKDVTGTVTLGGTPVVVKLVGAGTNGRFTFAGTTGQRVSVVVSQSTVGPACPALLVSLVRPNATTLGSPASTCNANDFLDTQTLDATGTWTVLLDPQGNDVGQVTLQAYAVTDLTAPIARNGKPTPVTISTPGQNARLTVSSLAGQQISAVLSASTFGTTCGAVSVSLLRPDGSPFGTSASTCNTAAFLDSQTFDVDGNWTLLIDPQGAATGTLNVQAFNSNDDTGIVHLGGDGFTVSTASPGENASIHFSGDTGQKISVQLSAATFTGCPAYLLSIVRPDGSAFSNTVSSCTAAAFLDAQVLDQTGMWTVKIDPQGTTTGTATLQAYDAADDTGTTDLVSGKPNVVKIAAPGQNGLWTFSGTTGQHVSVYLSGSTLTPCDVAISLVRPNGTTLGTPTAACGTSDFLEPQVLDATGTWTALVDPQGGSTGTATLQVFGIVDAATKFKPGPDLKTFTSLTPGMNAQYKFPGKVGDTHIVTITGSTYGGCPNVVVSFLRPNGSVAQTTTTCTKQVTLAVTFDTAGSWTLSIDPQGAAMGTMIIRLS